MKRVSAGSTGHHRRGPIGIRPEVASKLIREYIYLYGAVSPKDVGLRSIYCEPAPTFRYPHPSYR